MKEIDIMDIFIRGVGNISPQNTFDNTHFLEETVEHTDDYLKCTEPNYKEYINPAVSRRMSRIIKMGVTASNICLRDAGIDNPGAIITGTGLGCVRDTEKFLTSMITNDEKLLTPTAFIHSTHNTISAQIALLLKCNNYNTTYVHRGISFENALQDGMMLLAENEAENILTGGIDEITAGSFKITKRLGNWKDKPINKTDILNERSKGSIAGEGASYFLLTTKNDDHNYACLRSLSMIYKPESFSEIEDHISKFMDNINIGIKEIDMVLYGINGDLEQDSVYYHLMKNCFANNNSAYYKHLCGEYHTSTAFGLWMAANIIKRQTIPDVIKIEPFTHKEINNILIYNHYKGVDHSLMLISKC